MLGQTRSKLKGILLKVMKPLSFLPLTPNQFTFLAVPIAGIAAYYLIQENYFFALIFVLLALLIDLLDGSYAEIKKQKTFFGNYFDAVTDKIVEAIIYFGLTVNYPLHAFLAFAFTMLNSYAKPRIALVIETDNHDWPAVGERADRLLILFIGLILINFIPVIYGFKVIELTLALIASITFIGLIQRIQYAKKLIKKAEKEGKILKYLKK
ncbi:MAG: CDP-alcohol phosphatidyltransferase family protein [Candidatus Diapherotrites archaeon]